MSGVLVGVMRKKMGFILGILSSKAWVLVVGFLMIITSMLMHQDLGANNLTKTDMAAQGVNAVGSERLGPSEISNTDLGCGNILSDRDTQKVRAQELAQIVAEQVETEILQQDSHSGARAHRLQMAKGYGILVGAMLGSAFIATYATSHLPPEFHFLSYFLGQVSSIGVFVLGAPIWEPITSAFRKKAFGVKQATVQTQSHQPELEAQWQRTQSEVSLNAQMSRNLVNQLIGSLKFNLREAKESIQSGQRSYGIDQMAEAAVRVRTLFPDIQPDNKSLMLAVRSSFTEHIALDSNFLNALEKRIEDFDPEFQQPKVISYYKSLLQAWFGVVQ